MFLHLPNFDNICIIISESTKHPCFIDNRYLVRNENSIYIISTRNQAIVDTINK